MIESSRKQRKHPPLKQMYPPSSSDDEDQGSKTLEKNSFGQIESPTRKLQTKREKYVTGSRKVAEAKTQKIEAQVHGGSVSQGGGRIENSHFRSTRSTLVTNASSKCSADPIAPVDI